MRTPTENPHIELNETGLPYVRGTQFKAVFLFLDRIAYGWDAEEIQRQHPQLTLEQVRGALAYYDGHRAEMDELLERRRRKAEEILASLPESPARARLQAIKRERGLS